MKISISKFAPKNRSFNLGIINGVELSSINANISKGKKLDLLLIKGCPDSTVSGLFTKSATSSAAVDWSRKSLKKMQNKISPICILVNSGNANVFTGPPGKITVEKSVLSVTQKLNTVNENVFVASTGVIGELLDFKKITCQIDNLASLLQPNGFQEAAEAIMTTDTYPKGITSEFTLNGTKIKITGIAKGSGMIAPNMATMLVFIFSDIAIEKKALQTITAKCNQKTFNCITVDSDTSTSDSLFVLATNKAKMSKISDLRDPRAIQFQKHLTKIMLNLAKLVIKDGEGITKFIEVIVKGAKTDKTASKIGKAIAESPLVKTAFAGEDPNWGRIVMAIGKSGVKVKKERISIYLGAHRVAKNGSVAENYDEEIVARYMKNDSLSVTVDLDNGKAQAKILTCDLSHDYISINADYRS